MRFWAGDIAWTEARYLHRASDDIEDGGDNPDAYSVTYGFDSGMIANLILTRLRKTFWGDGYQDIAWDRGHLKIEAGGPVAYYYDGPTRRRTKSTPPPCAIHSLQQRATILPWPSTRLSSTPYAAAARSPCATPFPPA